MKTRLLKKLQSFLPLCERENEWRGYINTLIGKIVGLQEGGNAEVLSGVSLRGLRIRRKLGWAGWHTHPTHLEDSRPSWPDLISAHIAGGSEYLLTTQGIWEIKPLKVFPIEKVCQLADEALKRFPTWETEGDNPEYDSFWKNFFKEVLPTQLTLYSLSQSSSAENSSP